MDEESLEVIRKNNLFEGIEASALDAVLDKMETKKFLPGATVFNEGEMGVEFYIIISGKVSVYMEDSGNRSHVLSELNAGQSFGEMALIDKLKRSATVRCVEETVLSILTEEAFRELRHLDIETFSTILLNLAREISRRLRNMDVKYVKVMKVLF